jgi:methylmalonyl-CoA mutase cobalamin-binding domain/chain
MVLKRVDILPEADLTAGADLLQAGRTLAADWRVGASPFLVHVGQPSEAAFKRACAASGRVMQHAQIGFRDPEKTRRAYAEVYQACQKRKINVDRCGICLDWSMGYRRDDRRDEMRGTGLLLEDVEDFVTLTQAAPVAPHFGDFVLGFPAAIENTQAALAAGSTAIGNLGQYFTFRLPGWDDDVAVTDATVTALGLIAAQDVEILVHSNLDDGFAALFTDLSSSIGAVLLEKYIVEDLIGASMSHCYGHHFSDPVRRMAFQTALAQSTGTPGTMIYGNTVSYTGGDAENYASLAAYLLCDIAGQARNATGHAVNPVPIRENSRIPDIDEIIDAQLFAGRLIERASGYGDLFDFDAVERQAVEIVAGARQFFENVMAGLADAGIDVTDPAEMLLSIKRLGSRRLEREFGAGRANASALGGRTPVAASPIMEEVEEMARARISNIADCDVAAVRDADLKVLVATTDVHEHGKLVIERVFADVGVGSIDGGVSADPDRLVAAARSSSADAIAISTYNGIALDYISSVQAELAAHGLDIPVLVGGRLNQIPKGTNTSLPVDVTAELSAAGAIVCAEVEDAIPALLQHALTRSPR